MSNQLSPQPDPLLVPGSPEPLSPGRVSVNPDREAGVDELPGNEGNQPHPVEDARLPDMDLDNAEFDEQSIRAEAPGGQMHDANQKNGPEKQSPLEDDPFLIDPGNEDPGAGIDQILPEPASSDPDATTALQRPKSGN